MVNQEEGSDRATPRVGQAFQVCKQERVLGCGSTGLGSEIWGERGTTKFLFPFS